jgi:hypothetical protein
MVTGVLHYVDLPEGPVSLAGFPEGVRRTLDTINLKVAAAESLDRVMEFLFDATLDVCPCDRIGLAFVEEDGGRVVSRWVKATYEPLLLAHGYSEDMSGSSLEALLAGRKVRVIRDLAAYLEAHPGSRSTRILVREGVRSSMTCPLVVDGRTVGLLFRSSREPDVYGPQQVRMHLAVAERLAQAVEKAWRIERLEEANRAYTEMLGFVAHELKSPVASMVMDATMIREGYLGEVAEKPREKLGKMVAKGEYLLGLVRDYLDLARLESPGLTVSARADFDLIGEGIDVAVDIARADADARGMTIEVVVPRRPLPVEADPDLLKIVLVNLIGNGVKYGRDGGRVTVAAEVEDAAVVVRVRNEGPGFPESQKSRLFRKFSRLQTPELRSRKGTGVGLYTVWRIVRLHGGRVWAESQEGAWAEFAFRIPQPLSVDDPGGGRPSDGSEGAESRS